MPPIQTNQTDRITRYPPQGGAQGATRKDAILTGEPIAKSGEAVAALLSMDSGPISRPLPGDKRGWK